MNHPPPVIFVHGFIGTLDVAGHEHPHAAPDLLGYGHLMMLDDPAAFTAAIQRFLAD